MIFSQVKVADWPPFMKKLLIRLIGSLCVLMSSNFGHFPFFISRARFWFLLPQLLVIAYLYTFHISG